MGHSKALWFAICAFLAAFAQGEVSIGDLSGVWRGYSHPIATTILIPQGPAVVCVDSLPPECAKQLPPIEETYTINSATLSHEARDRIGITTIELSAQAFPACAKHGVFPIEAISAVPPSQIVSYDPEAERVVYIDARRPKEINCVPIKYRVGDQGPSLEVEHIITYQGNTESVFVSGPTFICGAFPQVCLIEEEGAQLNVGVVIAFNLTCIEGDCLSIAEAASPYASHAPKESPIDV